QRGSRMKLVNASPAHGFPIVKKLDNTVHAETNNYFYNIDHLRPNKDYWYWLPYYGGAAGEFNNSGTYTINIPNPVVTKPATVHSIILGFGDVDHSARITLNGISPSSGADPYNWTGKAFADQTWTFSS